MYRERARTIVSLHSFLKLRDSVAEAAGEQLYQGLIDSFRSSSSPHTSCAKCFVELREQDPAEAERVHEAAARFLGSISE